MKTLILSAVFLVVSFLGTAQTEVITELDEAKVNFAPKDMKISRDGSNFSFNIKESKAGEFEKNPMGFVKSNFNIYDFISENKDSEFNSYVVTFVSGNGYLKANYDKTGELRSTSQRFTSVYLPLDVRREVYSQNKGWTITESKYVASGQGEILDKEVYKFKLEKDGQKRTMKLDPRQLRSGYASNF